MIWKLQRLLESDVQDVKDRKQVEESLRESERNGFETAEKLALFLGRQTCQSTGNFTHAWSASRRDSFGYPHQLVR